MNLSETAETYQVATLDFAGPMDLLVFLVRRRELDVSYISVGAILADYLAWLEHCELTDLDSAGDFILLAAILLQYKAAELIPTSQPEPSEVELGEDGKPLSAEDLMALHLNAAKLAEMEERQINLFDRGTIHIAGIEDELAEEMMSDVSLYDLAMAFRNLIRELPQEPTHILEEIPFTIEGQMAFIMSFFSSSSKISFMRLLDALESRLAVIMTFLAMLELMRERKLVVRQSKPFGQFRLIKQDSNAQN